MAKITLPKITSVASYLSKEKLLPVYFLCGEDRYTIELAAETIEKSIMPYIQSDFDREIINAEKGQSLNQILDLAFSFPFGGGKKLIIIKNFEAIGDKKVLAEYLKSPAEFTFLIILHHSKISEIKTEPYNSLYNKNYIFEAAILKGDDLVEWLVKKGNKIGLNFSEDNARSLIEITGEDKSLLEMQLQKFIEFFGPGKQLSYDQIKSLASPTKQFTIFDLQDALGKGNKPRAVEVALSLLESGEEIIMIINSVAKFILTFAQITEVIRGKSSQSSDFENAKLLGISYGYFMNVKKATYFLPDERLLRASEALLKADLSVKTSSTDPKTILLVLISEMME